MGSIDFQARGIFIQKLWSTYQKKKDRENTCIPPSGKLLLTFNLFRQEMESYNLTTVNRGTGEERCNQAAHQLQGLHPVTFNSHSKHTICSAWYAQAIPIAGTAAISASSYSSSTSVSFLITTEHFHTSLVPHMKQITAKVLSTFLSSITDDGGFKIGMGRLACFIYIPSAMAGFDTKKDWI